MAELASLTKKRGSLKAKLTHFEKYIVTFEEYVNAQTVSKIQVTELNRRLERFETLIAEFDDVQSDIEITAENPDEHFEQREEFEHRFYSVFAKAQTYCSDFQCPENVDTDNHSQVSAGSTTHSVNSSSLGVKLPTINLPKFDGLYEHWMEFRDIFESLIHENLQINNIQKFHYLRASLEGSAAEVIRSLEFTSGNYELAWSTLCNRYNNVKLLTHNHVKAIFSLRSVNKESSKDLRTLNDDLSKHLSILKQLGEPVDSWDTLIIYIVSNKLDSVTAREWEKERAVIEKPSLDNFKHFLGKRADMLETYENSIRDKFQSSQGRQSRGLVVSADTSNSNQKFNCYFCKGNHSIFYCSQFLKLSVRDRMFKVKQLRLCINCLRDNHEVKDCTFSSCKICKSKHNTILHDSQTVQHQVKSTQNLLQTTNGDDWVLENEQVEQEQTNCNFATTTKYSLLPTAVVFVEDRDHVKHTARALLDCGSQNSFISTELSEKLNLTKQSSNLEVLGICDSLSYAKYKCNVKIHSRVNSFSFSLQCFIIDKITSSLPNISVCLSEWKIPNNIRLADPEFSVPNKIDILIGADAFWSLLCVGQIIPGPEKPLLQKTRLGWVAAGPIKFDVKKSSCHFSQNSELQNQVVKFWEIEEINPYNKPLSIEENMCEEHYAENVKKSADGRYIVSIPFKANLDRLGDSRDIAEKRFYQLEKKLSKNPVLRNLYTEFLREYEQRGHMTRLKVQSSEEREYYMPHHGVLKETSLTTKLRVVFNASSPSSTGVSLNDLQMTGPIIQRDLISILLSFRFHEVVLSSDIKMMYRQVLVDPSQRNLQKIIWREDPSHPLSTFQLNTVTYGTTSGSYLAIRSLFEAANEVEDINSKVANIIKEDMYVDDLLTGTKSVFEAQTLCKNVSDCLRRRGFELRKWRSNVPDAISSVWETSLSSKPLEFSVNKEQTSKTLGLSWESVNDCLHYKIECKSDSDSEKVTKRSILSKVASIFDPLGLLSPCIIVVKILLQKLWSENLTWDESLPAVLHQNWLDFYHKLNALNSLNITRKVTCSDADTFEIHGYSDASEQAYGACVYIKSLNKNNHCTVSLLCAKSKVAPLKTITTPRLELCAALLLSRLINKVINSVKITFSRIFAWTDSTIVLGWLRTSPGLLKPFVNHRVAEIQGLSKEVSWKHVSTKDNPADLLSRGVRPDKLINSTLWWNGPYWLKLGEENWPTNNFVTNNLPELKTQNFAQIQVTSDVIEFERFSNLNRLKRCVAYVIRFIRSWNKPQDELNFGRFLAVEEIEYAFELLIKLSQRSSFSDEYRALSSKGPISRKSPILNLNPFIDNRGLLRVGGRLENSEFSYSKKHPIILCHSHVLTKLILRQTHELLLHAGPQQLLSHIRETFWPTRGCARFTSKPVEPLMGQLPSTRVTPALPFSSVGVDYAGPLSLKDRRGRGSKTTKCWIAVFVCFISRSIHLELVTALSTEAFLLALKRFIGRRGKPTHIYSDNATNFIGANRELIEIVTLVNGSTNVANYVASQGITWHFIPPSSPHFGGLWEAAVKSLKFHLRRIMGNLAFTYDDLYTILVQIEAVLNSRPLHPMSSDPTDLTALTPAHFLIGRNLVGPPEADLGHLPENRLSHYQQLQRLHQTFWSRWSKDYISCLQERSKWRHNRNTLHLGQLVLLKDDNLAPLKWRLGRVVDLIYGKDGITRVASVKTAEGVYVRALAKICPLPLETALSKTYVESGDFQGGGHV